MQLRIASLYKIGIKHLKRIPPEHHSVVLIRLDYTVSFIHALQKLQTVSFMELSHGFEGKARNVSNLLENTEVFTSFKIDFQLIIKLIFRSPPPLEKPSTAPAK